MVDTDNTPPRSTYYTYLLTYLLTTYESLSYPLLLLPYDHITVFFSLVVLYQQVLMG